MLKPLQTTAEDLSTPQPWLIALEVLVVTLLLPALGLWRQSADPFFLKASFPWLALAPLLLGLRYGFAHGMVSAAALSALMYSFFRGGRPEVPSFPGSLCLGLLLVGMLAGEFCDMWRRRLHRLSEINYHHHLLVQKFSRSYQMLSLSHERLERRVLDNTRSLREALTYLRDCALAVEVDSPDSGALHQLMMKLLSSFGRLQVAALYRIDEYGIVVPQPVARLGNPKAVPMSDPLLMQALRSKQLVCVRPEELPDADMARRTSDTLLLALPLCDVHGRLWGVVTVQALPFDALSQDNLNLLAVLGGHMGDVMALADGGGVHQFHSYLLRSHRDARHNKLPAMLLGLVLDAGVAPPKLWLELLEQHRGLDQQWLTRNRDGQQALLTVMPLTNAEGAHDFAQRLNVWAQERYGKPLQELGVRIHQVILDGVGPAEDKLHALKEAMDGHAA